MITSRRRSKKLLKLKNLKESGIRRTEEKFTVQFLAFHSFFSVKRRNEGHANHRHLDQCTFYRVSYSISSLTCLLWLKSHLRGPALYEQKRLEANGGSFLPTKKPASVYDSRLLLNTRNSRRRIYPYYLKINYYFAKETFVIVIGK